MAGLKPYPIPKVGRWLGEGFIVALMKVIRTRYSGANIALLCIGVPLSVLSTLFTSLSSGFGMDVLPGLRGYFAMGAMCLAMLVLPVFLLALRWSSVAALILWWLTGVVLVLMLLGGIGYLWSVVVLIAILAGIASSINSRSQEGDSLRLSK